MQTDLRLNKEIDEIGTNMDQLEWTTEALESMCSDRTTTLDKIAEHLLSTVPKTVSDASAVKANIDGLLGQVVSPSVHDQPLDQLKRRIASLIARLSAVNQKLLDNAEKAEVYRQLRNAIDQRIGQQIEPEVDKLAMNQQPKTIADANADVEHIRTLLVTIDKEVDDPLKDAQQLIEHINCRIEPLDDLKRRSEQLKLQLKVSVWIIVVDDIGIFSGITSKDYCRNRCGNCSIEQISAASLANR
jgi:uncharacterized coiled-coil DUF342 family protein